MGIRLRHVVAAIGVSFLVSMGTLLWSAPGQASASSEPPHRYRQTAPLFEARGKVARLDGKRGHLVLKNDQGEITLRMDDATTLFLNGKTAWIDALKPGMEVEVTYETDGGSLNAQWIELAAPQPELAEKIGPKR